MEISFSYVITFISLIYGLAIAHALSCIAEYIQRWKEIKQYWVWWFWAIWLLMLSVGFWISIYTFYSKIVIWNVSYVFFLTLQASLFYLNYYIFFNHYNQMENGDLEVEFYKYKKPYYFLIIIQLNLMFFGTNLLTTDKMFLEIFKMNVPIVAYSIILIYLAYSNNKKIHKLFAIVFLSLFILQIILEF